MSEKIERGKKARGWFAKEVYDMRDELEEVKDKLEKFPDLLKFLDHPLIREYEYIWNKLRQLEQTNNQILKSQVEIDHRLQELTTLVRSLARPASRGA